MKVVISGGGTGGHVYPAIAIANKIKEMNPQAQIMFIGTSRGLEAEVVPRNGYPIQFIPVSYLKRKISWHNVKSAGLLIGGVLEARKILKAYRPDLVIGTGGFVCGPVLYMAAKLGIKTMIHEQNVYPGLTNRILSRYVDTIALSFDEARKYFKPKAKMVTTGNPIREDFLTTSREEALKRYHGGKPLVLIVGGSGGSRKLNEATIQLLKDHPENPFDILLVSGKIHYDQVMEQIQGIPKLGKGNRVVPYINDMPYALSACDIIVCSAGAITIAEITAAGKVSILIPKAHTAENHQEYNARALMEKGAALMIKESELNGSSLYNNITQVLENPEHLRKMSEASKKAARLQATDLIYREIEALLNR